MGEALQIAILGSRGIPAEYGGAETLAEELSQKLIQMGFEVYVTCESRGFHRDNYNGVIRIHNPSTQGKTITVPTIKDILATFHLLLRYPRIRLLYYTVPHAALAAVIPRLLKKKVVMNADGIEWKRMVRRREYFSTGWKLISVLASWYLRWTEWLVVRVSHAVIADSREIKAYLEETYKAKNVVYISYGARELLHSHIPAERERGVLEGFGLSRGEYYLTVGRIVAENNIHIEIEGFKRASSSKHIVIVGNFNEKDKYTSHLLTLRDNDSKIKFLNPIYDKEVLGILRKNCYAYIHAYEVGGTNPSLLEQMLFGRPIIAYDVPFHREVLQGSGIYFEAEDDLARCIDTLENGAVDLKEIARWQARRIEEEYNWDNVAEKYDSLLKALLQESTGGCYGP